MDLLSVLTNVKRLEAVKQHNPGCWSLSSNLFEIESPCSPFWMPGLLGKTWDFSVSASDYTIWTQNLQIHATIPSFHTTKFELSSSLLHHKYLTQGATSLSSLVLLTSLLIKVSPGMLSSAICHISLVSIALL